MPILEAVDPKAGLEQGDLLAGLKLYATAQDWEKAGLVPEAPLALVMSRPCGVAHKEAIIVAQVAAFKETAPKEESDARKLHRFLRQQRDGTTSPDRMYLGHLPDGAPGRYQAYLDSLHTVRLPEPDRLPEYLVKFRKARLNDDFRRDLHLRLFTSVARLGFHDQKWFTTPDLEFLVQQYEHDRQQEASSVSKQKLELARCQSEGFKNGEVQRQNMEADLAKAEKKLAELIEEFTPYVDELQSRKPSV